MRLEWTGKALSDLARLNDFLASVNRRAAAQVVRSLVAAPVRLQEHPRIGEKLDEFAPRDVRRLLIGRYEMRYEVRNNTVYVLRVWHTREERH